MPILLNVTGHRYLIGYIFKLGIYLKKQYYIELNYQNLSSYEYYVGFFLACIGTVPIDNNKFTYIAAYIVIN